MSRIVFLGDFSGLSFFLSEGIIENKREALIFSNGDGWKCMPQERSLFKVGRNKFSGAWNQLRGAWNIGGTLRSNDTLVLSTEFIFNRKLNALLLCRLLEKVSRVILLHAGCSDGFHRLNSQKLLCQNCKKFDLVSNRCVFDASNWPGVEAVFEKVDLVVPFTDIYARSANMYGVNSANITKPLSFPIDFKFVRNVVGVRNKSYGVLHGQNRVGFKGTSYLKDMMILEPNLSSNIELLPRMPFKDFIQKMNSSYVVLDQLFAGGYGMTGALALSMGTSVIYGYTDSGPYSGFDGVGVIPVPITGDTITDSKALMSSITRHFDDLPKYQDIVEAAQHRHDHKKVAAEFLCAIN